MKKEEIARIAAKWWRNEIAKSSVPQSGDVSIDGLALWARNLVPVPTEDQLSRFEENLTKGILDYLEINDTGWSEDNPQVGSALRVLSVDYDPHRILREAAEVEGISSLFFPIKTFMRLNPDGIEVSCGYRAPVEKITK